MKQLLKCLTIASGILSCNHGKDGQVEIAGNVDTSKNIIVTSNLNGCYMMNIGKDSAFLRLDANGIFVKGALIYERFEKDNNKGTIEGTITDNVIKAWYKFTSEGIISVREVYFRATGKQLAEGYGEMDMRNDTAYFKYPSTVSYEDHHPYTRINCDNNF
ncbi:MAG: hypothetical protein ABIO04_12065 [Ferruginibacter sp.]